MGISAWRARARQSCLMLLWLCAGPVSAGSEQPEPAEQLLNAMRTAMSGLSFRGIVAYSKNNEVENMEILHTNMDGIEREKLVSLNGPMREVVRQGHEVKCYFPDTGTVFIGSKPSGKSAFVDLPDNFLRLRPHYRFELGRRERIAQREAQEVRITPRDDMRYGRRIWVDSESKLALKIELLDDEEQVLEQMVFSSLDLKSPIPSKDFELSSGQQEAHWKSLEHSEVPIDLLRWRLHNVPTGFQIVSFSRVQQAPQDRAIEHLLLSDGLSSVSVYFDRVGEQLLVGQQREMGAINTFSRRIGEYSVTTMGEVPLKAVEYIGNGIRAQE